jgi:hypothetical protein
MEYVAIGIAFVAIELACQVVDWFEREMEP